MTPDLASAFLERSRYYLGLEYPGKIRLALTAMPADRLWQRANESSNSAGNLVLHLAGNVRQWIVSGVGGAPDVRHREAEFAARGGAGLEALLGTLESDARALGLSRLFCLTFEVDFFARNGFEPMTDDMIDPQVYSELVRSPDEGVAEFLDLARVKPNTLGNTRMIKRIN